MASDTDEARGRVRLRTKRAAYALWIAGWVCLGLPASPSAAGYLDGEWLHLMGRLSDPNVIAARAQSAMVMDTARDRLIVFGGNPGPTQDVWVLPMVPGANWERLVVNGTQPGARFGHCAIYDPIGDRILVFGGYSHGVRNDLWALALSGTPRWTNVATSGAPMAVQDASAVYDALQHRMVVFGGLRADGTCTNTTWALSLSGTPTWSLVPVYGTEPPARAAAQSALDLPNNRMVVFGGWSGNFDLDDTWVLGLEQGGYWQRITTFQQPPTRRAGAAVFDVSDNRMVVFGGVTGPDVSSDCWQLTLDEAPEWTELAPSGSTPPARSEACAVYDDARDRLVLFAGRGSRYLGDTRALALDSTLTWMSMSGSETTGVAVIEPRRGTTAAYRPATHQLIAFGGTTGMADMNDVWTFDLAPGAPSWWPMLPSGAPPSPRHGQAVVWDPLRDRLIMTGGFYDYDFLNDVWALEMNPSPTWHQIQPAVRPAGRIAFGFGYDAVRDRLILVGGHSGYAGSGAFRIDAWQLPLSGPLALIWSELAVLGPTPPPRWICGMQYDRSRDRFLIAGGVTASGYSNDVWALNLGGVPSWTQIQPAPPLPPARSDHAVALDAINDRLVMYGGYNGTFLSDAWALSLSGPPRWSQLAPIGPDPGTRDDATRAYDPLAGRMIVFGGWNGTAMLEDTWALTWGSRPVAIAASLMESHAAPGEVRLTWFMRDAASATAQVERRTAGAWLSIGPAEHSGDDLLTCSDTDVKPGGLYAYRLRLNANGEETLTAQTEIEVPTGYSLALAGARPNPTQGGPLNVAFALPRTGDGRLELMDLAGRRVASRDLRSLAPGQHRIVFSEAARAEPGVYLLRLVTSERTLTAKALITR